MASDEECPNGEDRDVDLNSFLCPKSIAIVGASATPGVVGYNFVANLIDGNFPGSIFPVKSGMKEVCGIRAYPDMASVPDDVELAVLATHPSQVPSLIRQCGPKGVKAAIVAAAGFADVGHEGKKLEEAVLDAAKEQGIRIMGPNTQGLINGKSTILSVPFRANLQRGSGVSFICQTGFFYWDWISRSSHVGLCKAVDLGNMCDVSHADVLEYLGNDPETRVIAMHIEGIRKGREFLDVAGRVTKRKPVIALKAGRTDKGAGAIASHTGSLVGDDAVYNAAFRQAGITRAIDMNELVDFVRVFACLSSLPKGNRVAVVTFSGAGGSLAADACSEFGLDMATLSESTVQRVRKAFPSWATMGNPIDVLQAVKTDDMRLAYEEALEALSVDQNVDAIVVITVIGNLLHEFDILDILVEHTGTASRKPTVICPLRFDDGFERAAGLDLRGFTVFPTVRRAVKALAVAHARYEHLS